MRRKINYQIFSNIKENFIVYLIITIFFAIGITFGAILSKGMNYTDKQDLVVYMNNFFQIVNKENVNYFSLFKNSIKENVILFILILIFSFTYLGSVISSIVSFLKGFTLGFTFSFFLQGFGWKGFLFFLTGILPQNMFFVPGFLIVCSLSMTFSITNIKRKRNMNYSYEYAAYTINLFMILLFILVGSIVETFISPTIVKGLSSYLTIQ